jgi:HEAT repeat protein
MRKFAAAGLCLLLGCSDNAFQREATYEGRPTSEWVQLAADDDVERRRNAVAVLGELGLTEADQSVPALAKAVGDADPYVRLLALKSLEKLAPKAKKAEGPVGRALSDKNKVIVKQALQTLKAINAAQPSALHDR